MKEHRVRKTTNPNGILVEVEQDRWIPVKTIPNHQAIHNHLEHERVNNTITIGFATRAFNIGLIKNWKKEDSIV